MNNDRSVVDQVKNLQAIKNITGQISGGGELCLFISPLTGSSKSIFIRNLSDTVNQILLLLPENKDVDEFTVELSVLGLSDYIIAFNDFSPESVQEKLTAISKNKNFIILATYDLLNLSLPPGDLIRNRTTMIEVGGNINYDEIVEYLHLLNFQQDKYVEAPGEFSVRGSIIDFWSYSEKNPVRLEFDGDFLESIRYFDSDSQRSIEKIDSVFLAGSLSDDYNRQEGAAIFDHLNNPVIIASEFHLKNLPEENFQPFNTGSVNSENSSAVSVVSDDDEFPEADGNGINNKKYEPADINKWLNLKNTRWIIESELGEKAGKTELGLSEAPSINGNYEVLFSTLLNYSLKGFDITITSENEIQTARLIDLLSEYKKDIAGLIDTGKVKIITLPLKSGFMHHSQKFMILTDYQIFNKPYRTKLPAQKKYKKSRSKEFSSIKRGDYVVHEDYGIGKYAGLEIIKIGEVNQESMKLLYNEGGIVYVNLNYLSLVKKYSASDNITPTLSTLGTNDWSNTKKRTKKKIKEAARELIELYAKRKAAKGFRFGADTVWQKELEASFFYEDTPDQEKVTNEVKEDMEAENPMDRLICGDVGFGKTEVAVRAAFKAVQDGKQTAVLVPTTILAEQHYNTFKDRLSQFPVKIAALSRFQSKSEQKSILESLENGNIDIVIGTHRLLSKDVRFKDLGLLIIDEEHRFGVTAKEKLRSVKVNVDTLTLTATPIPRTLNMSLLGARDLSIIGTPPPNRQPIHTTVSTFDIFKIKEWIYNELQRNGQVYFVHDRVQSINKLANYLNKYIPDVKIAVAHGQMKPAQLEKVIHGFLNREYDVLLSTKIIESGIDIPNVNTIIVNRADRFGLAELHQLRGRVGRSTRQAFAYFIVPSVSGITKKALRRLRAIEEFTEIGAGFNLSMRDLEIRGAGNLLGKEQSGFINEIGFDLYVKLINEAVEELKNQEFRELFKTLPKHVERIDSSIDTYFEIKIPSGYMPDQSDRLNFYTALYSVKDALEIDELVEEMRDRFGPVPPIVERLIAVAKLKLLASSALFERVIIQEKNILIVLPPGDKEDYYTEKFVPLMKYIMENYRKMIRFNQQKESLRLIIRNDFNSPEELLQFLQKFTSEVRDLFSIAETKKAIGTEII